MNKKIELLIIDAHRSFIDTKNKGTLIRGCLYFDSLSCLGRMDMKRLCGLMLFCVGFGMTWALILPTTFFLVITAAALMIVGYNLFCG